MKWLLVLIALFSFSASAADITGTWKASTETQDGTIETTFIFKMDGSKVGGSMANMMLPETPISEGKIEGDDLTFVVNANINGNDFTLNYKGKISGNEIKLVLTLPQGDRTFEMVAKKVT